MSRVILRFWCVILPIILSTGCVRPPLVHYSQSFEADKNFIETTSLGRNYLNNLLQRARGLQGGDAIFLRSSTVYWILPEIDRIDLELTSVEEGFEPLEYQTRLQKIGRLHDENLVFLALLKVPFYPKWTQSELLQRMKSNLIVTLENDTGEWQYPSLVLFHTIERLPDREESGDGEHRNVSIPIRFYFPRHVTSGLFLASPLERVTLKLRTKEPFPFGIGFQDEKFYQSFSWRTEVSD